MPGGPAPSGWPTIAQKSLRRQAWWAGSFGPWENGIESMPLARPAGGMLEGSTMRPSPHRIMCLLTLLLPCAAAGWAATRTAPLVPLDSRSAAGLALAEAHLIDTTDRAE